MITVEALQALSEVQLGMHCVKLECALIMPACFLTRNPLWRVFLGHCISLAAQPLNGIECGGIVAGWHSALSLTSNSFSSGKR